MSKRSLLMFAGVLGSAFLVSGCVSMQARLEDRARVDQDIPGQSPTPVKTRKVVVLEVTQKTSEQGALKTITKETATVEKTGHSKVVTESSDTTIVHDSNFTFPGQTSETLTQGQPAGTPVAYTVQKDDTLQKIAKKFLGSYSQWIRIYDANKDVIKNPNFVKPGIVLRIPVSGETANSQP